MYLREKYVEMRLATNPLIYVVDDDPNHLDLVNYIFRKYHAHCKLRCFSDGTDMLFHMTHKLDRQLPNLILLDWNMPVMAGNHVLELLRMDSQWQSIPVVVLSNSEVDKDRARSYHLGGRAFIAKAETLQELIDTIALILELWLP